jgi:hypothetical protein
MIVDVYFHAPSSRFHPFWLHLTQFSHNKSIVEGCHVYLVFIITLTCFQALGIYRLARQDVKIIWYR